MRQEILVQNIIDQVKEAQIKLGFARETVRLYYPISTLNAMLETDASNEKEMLAILSDNVFRNTILGDLRFSAHKQRIEVSVSPEGAEYVHKNVPEPAFLMDLIELFRKNHHCSLEEIHHLFESYSTEYICKKMPEGSDFDEVLYFKDSEIDSYFYCIKEEMGHTIYHRFTKADMIELL